MSENVNHPKHYNLGKIEVIDFIEDQNLGFNLGNTVKYVARAGKKNPGKLIEDLEKAAWYLTREILTSSKRMGREIPPPPGLSNEFLFQCLAAISSVMSTPAEGYVKDPQFLLADIQAMARRIKELKDARSVDIPRMQDLTRDLSAANDRIKELEAEIKAYVIVGGWKKAPVAKEGG